MPITRSQFLRAAAGGAMCLGATAAWTDLKTDPFRSLRGRLLFHRYSSYEAGDSRLYLYDFALRRLRRLGDGWDIENAMNADFSPDGESIVFMGIPSSGSPHATWSIFLWSADDKAGPVDLTGGSPRRCEDPKFCPDGKSIVFKRDGRVTRMDLRGRVFESLPDTGLEQSMPYVMPDGKHVVFAEGERASMRIVYANLDGTGRRDVCAVPDVQAYYPIPWGNEQVLYARWASASNDNDQIYCADLSSDRSWRLPFNDTNENSSDPAPAIGPLVFFSGTRPDSVGGYDLYLGDSRTGRTFSLTPLGCNSPLSELGSCYTPVPSR